MAAQEPRAELKLELDLPKTADCEEDFDLALYPTRGVELIAWTALNGQKCSGRRATIRYLPGKLTETQLLSRVKQLSSNLQVVKP